MAFKISKQQMIERDALAADLRKEAEGPHRSDRRSKLAATTIRQRHKLSSKDRLIGHYDKSNRARPAVPRTQPLQRRRNLRHCFDDPLHAKAIH
jgi:hypothetical protein